jgi:cbb3-type cytochrome oxidase subunit 3
MELLRNLIMLAAFASFLGIVWWAYTPARKARFDAQARSILETDDA